MLIESDVDSRIGGPSKRPQRFKLLKAQQRRMSRVGSGRLLALAQGVDLRLGLDAGRLGVGLRDKFQGGGLSICFRAMRVGFDLRIDALGFGFDLSFDAMSFGL